MKTKFFFLLTLLSFSVHLFGEGGKGKYKWPTYEPIELPDSLKNVPVLYLSNITTLDFMGTEESQIVIFKRIFINSDEAAEKYTKKEMYLTNGGYVSLLAARTIKESGETKELNNEQIIQTHARKKNKYGTKTIRRVQFLFPNLEVGDIIDIAYQIDYSHFLYSNLMYLEDDLPSLYSRITLRNMSNLELSIHPLNGMTKMIYKKDAGVMTRSWERYGVQTVQTDHFNALPPDIPSFIYSLWDRDAQLDYDVLYHHDARNYPKNFNTNKSFTKYFISNGIIKKEQDNLTKVQNLVTYFKSEMTWNYTKSTDLINRTADFLTEKKIDEVLFQRYLIKFFTENKIRYEKGFTKSIQDGKFEQEIVSLEQISTRYLLFYDNNGKAHFLFPPEGDDQFYLVDETPFYIEDNWSIVLYGLRNGMVEQASVKIPLSASNQNRHRAYIKLNLLDNDKLQCAMSRKDLLNGHYSFLARNSDRDTWFKELGIRASEISKDTYTVDPNYPYKMESFCNDTIEIIQPFDDSLYWFNPVSVLPKGIYQEDELEAVYGNYLVLPFLKENDISIFLNHDQPITLAEKESEIVFTNTIGSLRAKVYQMDPNTLKVDYTINIKKRYIKGADEVKQLKDIIQEYAYIKKKKWLISID